MEDACSGKDIPLIHGAIGGWIGQVAVVRPGARILHMIYQENKSGETQQEGGNPSFTPAVISGIQVAETIKVLLGKESALENKMLMMDLMNHEYEIIDFGV
jgi:molybdopterin/thiamine biosynthesis adenylyltransferase